MDHLTIKIDGGMEVQIENIPLEIPDTKSPANRIKIISENIPLEIQIEIIQRIPDTKSLIRFRSVSKAWKSVIDSKEFVAAHTLRHDQADRHHLLIRAQDFNDKKVKYVSIVDDDTFPHQKLNVFLPDSVNNLFRNDSIILGCSHGLLCLYQPKNFSWDPLIKRIVSIAVIWNPSIRKTVAIEVPIVLGDSYDRTAVGFGVCSRNLDPKLVKISYVGSFYRLQDDVSTSARVEVFTLSSGGTWRRPLSSNLPHKSIAFGDSQVDIDGFVYWNAVDRIKVGSVFRNLIISFDLTTEEFTKINLPLPLALNPHADLSVSSLRDSLAVLQLFTSNKYVRRDICDVWMMIGHGCTRSFNKLYSIDAPDASMLKTLGFRKSGVPILEVDEDKEEYSYKTNSLAIYEPESENITNIGFDALKGTFSVHSYMETLLLLGR